MSMQLSCVAWAPTSRIAPKPECLFPVLKLERPDILKGRMTSAGRLPPITEKVGAGGTACRAWNVPQLAGEAIALFFTLPVPGPVIGMALLFATLALRGGPSAELRNTAQNLLQHLSLLFVPAGVGVMLHFQRMADEWLPILVSLFASTFITIAITALVLRVLQRRAPEQKP